MAALPLRILAVFVTVCIGIAICYTIKDNCLRCICLRNDCHSREGKNCTDGACGPFYIKPKQWVACGSPEGDYEKCTKWFPCSVKCVKTYLETYGPNCTSPKDPTCKDYTRMHWSANIKGCKTLDAAWWDETVETSWKSVEKCCKSYGNCD